MLEEVDLFSSFYVACERVAGLQHLRVIPFRGSGTQTDSGQEIAFPEPVYSAHPHMNRVFDTARFRYGYQSMVTPGSVYEYDVATGESTLLKQLEVPGGFDRTLYAAERLFAKAPDGVEIPVSLVYRKDRREPGRNPLYVYGYGSYGYPLPIGFNSNRLSLLDRGFILAYAHIRGGGDLGKPWHDAGRIMQKRNTFTDFIAVTEHLLAQGYGDGRRVAIEGGSAGGLLMGAVANLRPDLFRAGAVARALRRRDEHHARFVAAPDGARIRGVGRSRTSSRPSNTCSATRPTTILEESLSGDAGADISDDSQVMYWEPAKYVAKLRTLKTDQQFPAAAHQHDGRAWRGFGTLRLSEGSGDGLRVPPAGA